MDLLGQVLIARGIISAEQLFHFLSIQQRSGSRLGDIVIAEGVATYLELYGALAEHYNLRFVNLLDYPPDEILLSSVDVEDYLRLLAIPWRRKRNKIIIAVAEYSEEIKKLINNKFGKNTEIVITSPLDIRKTIERIFGNVIEEESKLQLWQQNPKASARVTTTASLRQYLYILALSFLAMLYLFPWGLAITLIAFCNISYCASMLIKLLIFANGIRQDTPPDWQALLEDMDDTKLPIYTVLIPMYKEAASLPHMLKAMENLDYPAEKLDIKLVLEDDDFETLNVALDLKPQHNFEIIRVPHSTLRTKPKACNYALRFARGEYVTIFDADDIPDSLQLKKAVFTFRNRPNDVICLQARLNYYNADNNWLTRFFSLEYTILFDVMLHGLERMKIPLPLGGTSNHISLSHLREMGEWDAYNVTEDADLGVRLTASGYRTEMLDSYTLEESPLKVMAWIRQRSRWIKGYMQTWLVHMRNPLALYRQLGAGSFWGFQFFVGFSSFTFLSAPLLWGVALLGWWLCSSEGQNFLPDWLLWLTVANLIMNFVIHWIMLLCCTARYKIAAILYPFYLTLHSIASYKALYQLIVKPHFWEKTTHGLARVKISG